MLQNSGIKLQTTATGVTVTGEVASSQDYPTIRPTLDFNFAATKKLDPRLEYERTGPASFVNEFGKVVLVGDNSPRFDHDPTTRESKGLLIEESRKNYLENGDFVSSYGSGNSWAYGVGTDVFSASSGSQLSTNPDETSPAYHYAPSSTAGYHRFNRTFTVDAYDTKYVVSVFAKRVTEGSASGLNRYLEIEISGNFALNGAPTGHSGSHGMSSVTFDLQGDGAISSETTTSNGYVGSPKMEKYPNGWWRLSYVFNPGTNDGSSSLTGNIWFGHPASLANDAGNETGNGNPSFYLWGAMIEKGGFLTSYIPNHGVYQLTRGRDELTMSGSDLTDVFNNEEGTMFYEASLGDLTNDNQPIVAFRDLGTTTVDYHAMGWRLGGGTGVIRTWFKSASNNEHLSAHASTGLTSNMFYKHIYGYKDADCADAYRTPTNSGILSNQIGNGSPMIAAGVVDELRFGGYYAYESQPDTYGLDAGHIKRFSYWPQRLTNSQLTTYIS